MSKFVFIGDIHGKSELVEAALARDGKKIFVGDFIDSFDHSIADHRKCYELVLAAIKSGEAESIFGNHELSYLMIHHRCSGHTSARRDLMQEFELDIRKYFVPFILLQKDFLVSHAGLTKQIWDRNLLTLESLPQALAEWWPDFRSPMHHIGQYRGGRDSVGGLFWCDFNREFEPVPGLTQVFGHTAAGGNGIRRKGDSYCIDCLERSREFLELETE